MVFANCIHIETNLFGENCLLDNLAKSDSWIGVFGAYARDQLCKGRESEFHCISWMVRGVADATGRMFPSNVVRS